MNKSLFQVSSCLVRKACPLGGFPTFLFIITVDRAYFSVTYYISYQKSFNSYSEHTISELNLP
jgi:hypothetical protein